LLENGIDNGLMKNLPKHNDLRTLRRYLHVNCKHIRHVEHPLLALVRKQRKRPT
jgi:site-specific recombinase XerD